MKRQDRRRAGGFSLTEVVLALAIIATCFVALLGMLPAGMNASREAANSTVVAAVLGDLHHRLQNQPLRSGVVALGEAAAGEDGRSPVFYDDHGAFIAPDAQPADLERRLYRADVRIAEWRQRPANTGGLLAVIVALSWPVNPQTGEAIGAGNPKATVTYGVTALTGPDWKLIYPLQRPDWQYQERIEF